MKKIVIMCLLGAFVSQIYSVSKKDERTNLVLQCRAIRERIRHENNFEIIKQNAIRGSQETNASIEARFGFKPQGTESTLMVNLNALEVEHNIRLNALVVNTITAYLSTLNTPQARGLLAEFIASGFVF